MVGQTKFRFGNASYPTEYLTVKNDGILEASENFSEGGLKLSEGLLKLQEAPKRWGFAAKENQITRCFAIQTCNSRQNNDESGCY